jgi:hypothetical protein
MLHHEHNLESHLNNRSGAVKEEWMEPISGIPVNPVLRRST